MQPECQNEFAPEPGRMHQVLDLCKTVYHPPLARKAAGKTSAEKRPLKLKSGNKLFL